MTSNFKSITWVFKLCRDWKNKAKALERDPGMWAIKKQITWNNHWSAIYVKLASPWWHSWRWLADSETPSLCRSPTGSSGRCRFPELCCQDNILEFGPGIKAQMLTSDPFVFMAKPSGGRTAGCATRKVLTRKILFRRAIFSMPYACSELSGPL